MAYTGTITSQGVGSNLDINGIVSKLMQVESQPLTRLQTKKSDYQARLSALGLIQSALSSFQSAVSVLRYGTSFQATTVSSANSALVSASSTSGATAGNYSINITNTAQSEKLVAVGQASSSATIGTGTSTTVTIDLGTTSGTSFTSNGTPFNVVIDSTNNTLTGIRDAINAANGGVTASIVNDGTATPYRLVLTSNATGANQSMKITTNAGDASIDTLLTYDPAGTKNLTETSIAKDAQFTVDGIAMTKSSNTVTDAISGVTLNLLNGTSGASVTVSVAQDVSAIKASINNFVSAYNDLIKQIKTQTDSGVTSGKAGALASDSLTRDIESSINSLLNTPPASATGTYKTLSSIGVSFQQDGTLAVDDATLTTALQSDSANVEKLFTATDGYGTTLSSYLSSMLNVGGTLDSRTTSYTGYISSLDNQITTEQSMLTRTEQRLRAQFTSLDVLISQLSVTSNYLTQQLTAMSNTKSGG